MLKIEVGKKYRLRNGQEVEIIGRSGLIRFPFRGDDNQTYTEDGLSQANFEEWEFDIVEEITKFISYEEAVEAMENGKVVRQSGKRDGQWFKKGEQVYCFYEHEKELNEETERTKLNKAASGKYWIEFNPSENVLEALKGKESSEDSSELLGTSNGLSASYYDLPEDTEELQDLIEHKDMNFSIGNIFKACYRLGEKDSVSAKYDLEKIVYFAQRELKRIDG